jgi:hypothetical protein
MRTTPFWALILGLALSACGGAKAPGGVTDAETTAAGNGSDATGNCGREAEIYGVVAGGRPLCAGRRTVAVNVRGDLGDQASFAITGPNGYTFNGTAAMSGKCLYHFSWDFGAGLLAGEYTVAVTGSGKSLSSKATVEECGGT